MSAAEPHADKSVDDAAVTQVAGVTETAQATEASEAAEAGEETVAAVELTEAAQDTEEDPKTWASSGLRRPKGVLRAVAAAVLIAVLTVAGVEGWFLFQQHQRDVAGAQALDAATAFTVKLANINPEAVDQNLADVLDGSTGKFKDLYTQSSEQLRQALIENEAAAHGTVIDAAVKSATKKKVEVMLFVDQTVRNSKLPQMQLDRSRIVLTMEKVDGRWLASDVEHP